MEFMCTADTNRNGELSVSEFVKHARSFPLIIKPAYNLQKASTLPFIAAALFFIRLSIFLLLSFLGLTLGLSHTQKQQLRKRIISPYFWKRRAARLAERYNLVTSKHFQYDWAGRGDVGWWGAYEHKFQHGSMDGGGGGTSFDSSNVRYDVRKIRAGQVAPLSTKAPSPKKKEAMAPPFGALLAGHNGGSEAPRAADNKQNDKPVIQVRA